MGKLTKAVDMSPAQKHDVYTKQIQATQNDQVGGRTLLQLDEYANLNMPSDWEVDQPLHDILMVELVDENEHGEILRGGIFIKQEVVNKLWRVGRVVKTGPAVKPYLEVGKLVMFPSDRGIPIIAFGGKKVIFLNEDRIFAIVKPLI
jgi:co-chaperonin GroES (HSP10)